MVWPALTLILAIVSISSLLWRHTHPFAVTVLAFGAQHLTRAASTAFDAGWSGLFTMIGLVLLPYSLVRHERSGRILVGLTVVLFGPGMMFARRPEDLRATVAATMLLLIPAGFGLFARQRDTARRLEVEAAKQREREQIARELHDTVAHHVSAVVVQAQAGRALASSDVAAPLEALEAIEEAATRTLIEMRQLVHSLRYTIADELAPLPGLSDIQALAAEGAALNGHCLPRVQVSIEASLEKIEPLIGAALFRIAQEALTNAIKHAPMAKKVEIRLDRDGGQVVLVVRNDGALVRAPNSTQSGGFGITGMGERAKLFGGTLTAGPCESGGWMVRAELPLRASQ